MKGSLNECHRFKGEALSDHKPYCSCLTCCINYTSTIHRQAIINYYSNIVALNEAEKLSISSILHSALRHFLNDELDEVKKTKIVGMISGLTLVGLYRT